jgi:uncharacterized protein YjbI with pentapeptide repeats
MANTQHLQLLDQGVEVWNAWREEQHQLQPDLRGADLAGRDLSHFSLWKTQLQWANLTGASLRNASLLGADLSHASLVEADLQGANLGGARLVQATCAGVDFGRMRLRWTRFTEADLSRANFAQAILEGARFERANLQGAWFDGADLSWADFTGADLSEASFLAVHLKDTQLADAKLSQTSFRDASFNRALFQHTNFSGAVLWDTSFLNVDLSEARGLDAVQHLARSSLDLHTWVRSQGKIPPSFLRGSGVPELLVRELSGQAVKPAPEIAGFLSYHPADEAFARRLLDALQAEGVRCWLLSEQFYRSDWLVHKHTFQSLDKVFLIYSEHVIAEPMLAIILGKEMLEREKESSTQLLFPLHIDQYSWDLHQADKEHGVPERWAGNFVGWQEEEAFQKALQDLLDVLRQEGAGEP